MSETQDVVEKRIHLSADRAKRLDRFVHARRVSEDQIFERAPDILFALTDLLNEGTEPEGWALPSEVPSPRSWDSDTEDEPWSDWLGAQSQSAAYQEWLSDDNDIYDELFSDVDPKR